MAVLAPPAVGGFTELKRRYFATPFQALVSLFCLTLLVLLLWKLLNWAITKGQSYGPPLIFEPIPKAVATFDKKQIKKIQ